MKRNNKKGFTIVELVIVIAVIGILAAVLIPTFSGVIADANDAARDQEAKNLYTTYVAKEAQAGNDPVSAGYVAVEVGTNEYIYYTIVNGNVNVEDDAAKALPAGNYHVDGAIYVACTDNACTATHTTVTAN